MYTNNYDPNNGTILISHDRGDSFTAAPLPFKVGGNMPGRGLGERLAVDPNNVRKYSRVFETSLIFETS